MTKNSVKFLLKKRKIEISGRFDTILLCNNYQDFENKKFLNT